MDESRDRQLVPERLRNRNERAKLLEACLEVREKWMAFELLSESRGPDVSAGIAGFECGIYGAIECDMGHVTKKEIDTRDIVQKMDRARPCDKFLVGFTIALVSARHDSGISHCGNECRYWIRRASNCVANERKMLDVGGPSTLKSVGRSGHVSPDSC